MKSMLAGMMVGLVAMPAAADDIPASARPTARHCLSAASLFSPDAFGRYPADADWRGVRRAPDVRRGNAHLYRTLIRQNARSAPDFAGHYKIVRAGCGAGMICPLILDLKTGRVWQIPGLKSVEWGYSRARDVERETGFEDSRLVYRRDSRLLVALGTRNEDPKLAGAIQYEWTDRGPQLLRSVPDSQLCPGSDKL
ncbi:hypothetical protein ACG3SL_18955 [Sphingomonas sp. CJ20]